LGYWDIEFRFTENEDSRESRVHLAGKRPLLTFAGYSGIDPAWAAKGRSILRDKAGYIAQNAGIGDYSGFKVRDADYAAVCRNIEWTA
jgi:hypothetical protein